MPVGTGVIVGEGVTENVGLTAPMGVAELVGATIPGAMDVGGRLTGATGRRRIGRTATRASPVGPLNGR